MNVNHLYKILGYLGAIPFFIFFAGVVANDYIVGSVSSIGLITYGALILSFLGGIHWPLALKSNDHVRLLLSMLPTILGLVSILMHAIGLTFYAFFLLSILFWTQFFFDKSYAKHDEWPDGYIAFRFKITCLISLVLIFTWVLLL